MISFSHIEIDSLFELKIFLEGFLWRVHNNTYYGFGTVFYTPFVGFVVPGAHMQFLVRMITATKRGRSQALCQWKQILPCNGCFHINFDLFGILLIRNTFKF